MLKVDLMKTSRGAEDTKATTLYILPATKSEDGIKETTAVCDRLRELSATAKINPGGKIKLEF